MEYLENENISVKFNGIIIEGMISGFNDDWKFTSTEKGFLKEVKTGLLFLTLINIDSSQYIKNLAKEISKITKNISRPIYQPPPLVAENIIHHIS